MSMVYAYQIIGLIFFFGLTADHLRHQWDLSYPLDWLDFAFCLLSIVALWPMLLWHGYRDKEGKFWKDAN